jgi:hypothetical protein
MSWIVESHSGPEESFVKNGPDHTFIFERDAEALSRIVNIFTISITNREHQSPLVRLRYEE